MKYVIVFLLVSVYILTTVAAEKTCKQFVSDLTKRQMGGMGKCTKSMKFKNGKDKSAKMTCVLKCVMMNEGFLDQEGKMTKEQFESFISKELPESLHAHGIPLFDKCRVDHAEMLDNNEEFCKTYDPLVKCMMGAITKLCI